MKNIFLILFIFGINLSFAQVYNFGANEVTFKNMVTNGITYVKTGDAHFDSIMIANLEEYWTFSEFSTVEQYKRPDKTSTALFVTTKEFTKKHMMDRKNQHVLVLQHAEIYVPRKDVKMEHTLGYMYINGFYDLVSNENEYRYAYMLVKALNKGFSFIKNERLTGEPEDLNALVSAAVTGDDGPSVGNVLILNREQTRHAVVREELDKLGVEYRLLAEEEYYSTLERKDPTHIVLYFAVNRFTEMALVRISDGEMLCSKHFRENYPTLTKKELKLIAGYFN
ncbi:MAG: hypothetical protein P8I55_08245 [Crocinitomix sp.]|nr:hypothetical protein [Crocinitomix sp.]